MLISLAWIAWSTELMNFLVLFKYRILIIFRDGFIALWTIGESKSIFTTGGNMFQSLQTDKKEVTSACWGCPFGSKVIVGYSNGDVFIWSVSPAPELGGIAKSQTHRAPICRLNLGFKLEKIPIGSLKFAHADGKATRVYILGATNSVSENLLQVWMNKNHRLHVPN